MNAPSLLCTLCARFGDSEGVVLCEAFPHGIPREIFPGGFDHSKLPSGGTAVCAFFRCPGQSTTSRRGPGSTAARERTRVRGCEVKKNIEQLMRKAEGALGKAFGQLDYAGGIARKLEAATAKPRPDESFVELMIVRELIDRVERICNAAFIADARAAGPLPFPPAIPPSE